MPGDARAFPGKRVPVPSGRILKADDDTGGHSHMADTETGYRGSRKAASPPRPAPPRYVITVAVKDTGSGFVAAWSVLDRRQGLYYSFRHTFDDPSLPRVASALVLAARGMAGHPDGRAVVLMPACSESAQAAALFHLWKEGSDALYAHEDCCYWEEVFRTLGPSAAYVEYADSALPTVAQCSRMLP